MTESTITCDRCSAPVPAGASKCPNCGAPLTEAAATGFETTKIGDMFATTKLEMPPEEPVADATIMEEPSPETVPVPEPETVAEPEPARSEPIYEAPAPATQAFTPTASAESVQPAKEWYRNPLVIGIGCAVLFMCCVCVAIVAAVIALLPAGL